MPIFPGCGRWLWTGGECRAVAGFMRCGQPLACRPPSLRKECAFPGRAYRRLRKPKPAEALPLGSLEKAAEALDCTLIYALVPRRSLNEIVETRAREKATMIVSHINHTMLLEAQNVDAATLQKKRDDLAADMLRGSLRGLWSDE